MKCDDIFETQRLDGVPFHSADGAPVNRLDNGRPDYCAGAMPDAPREESADHSRSTSPQGELSHSLQPM